MINRVSFSMPQSHQAPAFKASPKQIANDILLMDTEKGKTSSDLLMELEDEPASHLRAAAKLLKENKDNLSKQRARMLDEMAEISEQSK